jgi:GTP-binding protein
LPKVPPPAVCPFADAKFHAQAKTLDQLPAPTHTELAFAGRSNVGKSSLLNAVFERKNLVRTSQTPGCTQAINFFEARTREGVVAHFVDLPGYGYAERSKADRKQWGELIEGYLLFRPTLRAVVLLVDARRDFEAEERDLLDWLTRPSRVSRPRLSIIVAATKTDQLTQAALAPRLKSLSEAASSSVFGVSVREPRSVDRLRKRLLAIVAPKAAPENA